jgi:hypothetical protein
LFVIISQLARAMEDGKRTVHVSMDPHPDLDVMASIPVSRDLQCFSLKADTVVSSHCPFIAVQGGTETCTRGNQAIDDQALQYNPDGSGNP